MALSEPDRRSATLATPGEAPLRGPVPGDATARPNAFATRRSSLLLLVLGAVVLAASLASQVHAFERFDLTFGVGAALLGAAGVLALSPSSRADLARGTRSLIDARRRFQAGLERLSDLHWRIEDSAAHYRGLLDEMDAIVCRRDAAGRLTFVNRAYCRTFGVDPESAIGSAGVPFGASVTEPEADGPERRWVAEIATATGSRWFAFVAHRVPVAGDGAGTSAVEVQIVGNDVTEQRVIEAELMAAKVDAEAASRAKSRFLAAVSHEIRTPMNGILGMVGLLGDTRLTLEQQSYARTIEESATTLLGLIDEVLDFSRVEAGRMKLETAPFSLEMVTQGVVELLAPRAFDKGLELAWTIDAAVPGLLIGDEVRVRQILVNLVGNAVKFTDQGGVWVRIEAEPDTSTGAPAPCRVRIEVQDTGIGLTPEAMQRIFGEFEQAGGNESQKRGGTGLGLAISQSLARAMGGEITVTSQPQRGSTFTVQLAMMPVTAPARPAIRAILAPGERVLLISDRLVERRALAAQIRSFGPAVAEADTLDGRALARQAEAIGQPFAAVIVDGECGPAEMADIAGGATRGIVVVPPNARADLEAFRAVGFGEFLIRPVRPRSLAARILSAPSGDADLRADRKPDGTLPARDSSPPSALAGLRVLLVEDNPVNALVARRQLEGLGVTVVDTTDGREAVARMRRVARGEAPPVDIVLMDMHMPNMGGLDATAAIRALVAGTAGFRQPAIIALTASAFEEDRRECLGAGMDDYLAKPFTRSELEMCIVRWSRGRDYMRATSATLDVRYVPS